jgi:CHAD domain-containing protein
VGLERELKAVAETDAALPDLTDVVDGATLGQWETLHLLATYHDTDTFALARHGATLRSRSGEPGPTWTVKLPGAASDGSLTRREVTFTGPASRIPPGALDAVSAYRRRSPVRAVAELRTLRRSAPLLIDGQVVATVCDDDVEATVGGHIVRFREIEVELAEGSGDLGLLKAVRHRLRANGWNTHDPRPKLVRVLGSAVLDGPDVVAPKIAQKATLGDAISAGLARSVAEIIAFDAGVRLGGDIEDVHQFRVAARRMRSDLRTFRSLLDPAWSSELSAELKWLGQEVGAVRDLDVLRDRISALVEDLHEPDATSGRRLLARLDGEREAAGSELLAAMRSDRYAVLLDRLVDAAAHPRLAEVDEGHSGPHDRPVGRVMAQLVRKPWKKLRRTVGQLTSDPTDAELHAVRILAKRCRYAAEAVVPVCGLDAKRFALAVKDVQSVLGDHQDTVITEDWLRAAAKASPDVGVAVGLLVAMQRAERARLRAQFEQVWERTARPSMRSWLS